MNITTPPPVLGDHHHHALPTLGDDDALLYTGALGPLGEAGPEVCLYRILLGVGTVEPVREIVKNNPVNIPMSNRGHLT